MDEGRWALFKRQSIPDLYRRDHVYIDRLRLVQTPWFGVFYHKIYLSDTDRDMHNHPWNFVSVVLTGGYTERLKRPLGLPVEKKRRPLSVCLRRRNDWHIVTELRKSPTRTLLFVGRDYRDWQFLAPSGPVEHDVWLQGKRFERSWNRCTHYDTECPAPWECSEVHNICALHRLYTHAERALRDL